MAGTSRKKQLALDANLLFDLAAKEDFAHDFKEEFQRRGYVLSVPPTALVEVHLKCTGGETAAVRSLARTALMSLNGWNIKPFDLPDVSHEIAERFAQRLIHASLLPEGEWNDGRILAETALAEIPALVTSDKHLLDMDPAALKIALDEAELSPVAPCHPKRLLRALR